VVVAARVLVPAPVVVAARVLVPAPVVVAARVLGAARVVVAARVLLPATHALSATGPVLAGTRAVVRGLEVQFAWSNTFL
jgi:hypothetical protein